MEWTHPLLQLPLHLQQVHVALPVQKQAVFFREIVAGSEMGGGKIKKIYNCQFEVAKIVDHKHIRAVSPLQGECQVCCEPQQNSEGSKAKFERTVNNMLYRQWRIESEK